MKKKSLFLLAMFLLVLASPLFAAEDGLATFGLALGAGLAIGIAAMGGGIGQGLATSAALEGIARNPNASDKIFTPMIIGLALIESLVIYGLVIAFILQAKI
ncbi:MAG: ATP synthase F0 subunit C [SAR324 cluster bacterium]|nr:ATP synthase F0 subunit C [SAR324 cluster bacterium]MCZ6647189.1 ATP synthase F0 subunit C [SAR324 cluster bacterium]MCZ6729982.1 ATP synthase F0 subunit C [SAR324 cluster bacterium]